MLFMCLLNWTDQGIRSVKEAPRPAKAAQELAKKLGVEIKETYPTSGDSDLLVILETPNSDNVAKFALCRRRTWKRAHPHRPHLAAGRISKDDLRTAIAVPGAGSIGTTTRRSAPP